MNELQLFHSDQFGEIRTATKDGRALFCGSDVAKALGYANPSKALSDHCKGVTKRYTPTTSGDQQMSFIGEADVYRLVFGSKLPNAERFTDWVTEEVLPTIRKTGGYVNDDEAFLNTYLPNADETTRAMFAQTLQTVRRLNSKIEQDKPKVLFATAVESSQNSVLVGELAKILRQNGVEIGQQRLFDYLRRNGYLISRAGSDRNMPTQRSMDMGLFRIKETAISHADGAVSVSKTVKVTGKGQQYFIQKFLGGN